MKVKERAIQYLWDSKRLPTQFTTVSGKSVRVIRHGHLNHGRGPDFQNAEVVIDGEHRCGDVEIHLRSKDWRAHGHHRDPHYHAVVLQVVWDGQAPAFGAQPEAVCLDRQVFTRPDPVLPVPPAPSTAEKFCPAFGVMRPHALESWFEQVGWERLLAKAKKWANASTDDPSQAFYEFLLIALGYTRNTEPMRKLAQAVSWRDICAMRDAGETATGWIAIMLGVSGLLAHLPKFIPAAVAAKWSEVFCRQARFRPLEGMDWQLFRIRPQNHPVLRLMQVAGMLATCSDPLRELGHCFTLSPEYGHPSEIEKRLSAFLNVPLDEDLHVPSLGNDRLHILLINVFLPILIARSKGDLSRLQALRRFCREMGPLPANRNEDVVRERLSDYQNRATGKCALSGQGIIEVYQRYCETQRCDDCRLALHRFLRLPDEFQR